MRGTSLTQSEDGGCHSARSSHDSMITPVRILQELVFHVFTTKGTDMSFPSEDGLSYPCAPQVVNLLEAASSPSNTQQA